MTSLLLTLILYVAPARASHIYVSADGNPFGTGTPESPIDLATAFSDRSPAQPGDTIWLRGGVYWGKYVCQLNGTSELPITVRSYPNEWAKIDSGISTDRASILQVVGSWTTFRDMEITSSDPVRDTEIGGSYPGDIRRGEGIQVSAPGTRLINLVIHDTAGGVGAWSEAPDTEIYGCLIYYNGWQGPDRAHGHGIYSQNMSGSRLIRDNIIFGQFEKGIQVYGSSVAYLRNHHLEGNIVFNNGLLANGQELSENLTIYGGHGPEGCVVRDNLFYGENFRGKLMIGGDGAKDLVFENNYVPHLTRIRYWKTAAVTGNTFVRDTTVLECYLDPESSVNDYVWDRNSYYDQELRYSPFGLYYMSNSGARYAKGLAFGDWRQVTGFDRSSVYIKGRPTGSKVAVRANAYDKNRAHIAIYNWDRLPELAVELQSFLANGQAYEIYDAQNYFGSPVAAGIFDGSAVTIPMSELSVAQPIGRSLSTASSSEFNVFIVKAKEQPAAPTRVNTPPTVSTVADQVTTMDVATSPISFVINDVETPADQLAVLASSSNPTLVPAGNIQLGGSGATRTVTIVPAPNQLGTATISISVNDGRQVAKRSFLLTVEAFNFPPVMSRISDITLAPGAGSISVLYMVGDPDNAAGDLIVTARSSDPEHIPVENIVAEGSDSLRTLTISPNPNHTATTRIHLTVSDGRASSEMSFLVSSQ